MQFERGNQTLWDVWHGLRDLLFIVIVLFGRTINLQQHWAVYLIAAATGWWLWQMTYNLARRLQVGLWDAKYTLGLPFELLGFGKYSGRSFLDWLKDIF